MTRRAGGWILALLVVGTMGAGAWFLIRRTLHREHITIQFLGSRIESEPTRNAVLRGARFALEEAGHRAGRYRPTLQDQPPGVILGTIAAWIGTDEAIVALGHQQGRPFSVSVLDTHPTESNTSFYRINPGWERQAASAARWAKKSGAARVSLLYDPASPRSISIASKFMMAAAAIELAVEKWEEASIEVIDRLPLTKLDVVYFAGEEAPYQTAAKIFEALRRKGFSGKLVTGEADPEVSYLATRSGPLDGTYLVSPFAPAPPELAARMGFVPGPHVTAGYYGMKLILDTIDRANSVEEHDLHRVAATLQTTRRCALYVAKNGVYEFVELLD